MKSIKIAHIADVHINTPFTGLDEEKAKIRRHELIEAFESAIELAKKECVDFIAISGDLFDNNSDMRTVKYIIDRLGACGVKVFISAGNHDPKRIVYDAISLPENVYVFNESMECIQLDDVCVYGASFAEKNCEKTLLNNLTLSENTINILIMHGDVGTGAYNPMDRKLLAKFDYCALGHIHEYSGIVREGEGTWAYSGFCEPRGFDEKGRGGFILANVGKKCTIAEYKTISKREYITADVDITDLNDNVDIIYKIEEILSPENIYSINLVGVTSDFVIMTDYIKNQLEAWCFDIEINVENQRDYDAFADGYTLRGLFVTKMLELASRASESDKKKYMRALDIGLDAFEKVTEKK